MTYDSRHCTVRYQCDLVCGNTMCVSSLQVDFVLQRIVLIYILLPLSYFSEASNFFGFFPFSFTNTITKKGYISISDKKKIKFEKKSSRLSSNACRAAILKGEKTQKNPNRFQRGRTITPFEPFYASWTHPCYHYANHDFYQCCSFVFGMFQARNKAKCVSIRFHGLKGSGGHKTQCLYRFTSESHSFKIIMLESFH